MTGWVRGLRDTQAVLHVSCPDHCAAGPVVFQIIWDRIALPIEFFYDVSQVIVELPW